MKVWFFVALGAGTFAVVFAAVLAGAEYEKRLHPRSQEVVVLNQQGGVVRPVSAPGVAVADFRVPAKRALESTVSIQTFATMVDFFNPASLKAVAQGSGVVVDKSGYILTNNHVVRVGRQGLAEKILVTLNSGKAYNARLVGIDPRADLAVLKVDGVDVTPIDIGDSSKLEVGQWVLAVGNPLGYSNTVTLGIVSSLGRDLGSSQGLFGDGIQTDAAINSGNSGGALIDDGAHLVGITTAIAVASEYSSGNIGIGFAIPVNRVMGVFNDIKQFGHARYGDLGITEVRANLLQLDQNREFIRRRTGAEPPKEGLLIMEIRDGTPAATAGIKPLDVLLAIDGKPAQSDRDYSFGIEDRRPGEKVELKIWSAGKIRTVSLVLVEAESGV